MKYLLFSLSLLMMISCNAIKQKDKTKSEEDIRISESLENKELLKSQSVYKINKLDSTAFKSDLSKTNNFQTSLQNLSLKNNGKCAEPGETTYMEFSDQQGNNLRIPVNQNTELSFGNENLLMEDNTKLSQHLSTKSRELQDITTQLNQEKVTTAKLKVDLEKANQLLQIKNEKPIWYAFLFWCVIAIIVWEVGIFYLKKLL